MISTKSQPAGNINKLINVLLLVPDLNLAGGVSGYYNTLKLDEYAGATYFFVNSAKKQKGIILLLRLIKNYFRYFFLLAHGKFSLVHFNPSLDKKSFYRDAIFIIIARGLGRKTLVFFRGWLDAYEEEIKKSKLKSFLFDLSFAKADRYIVLSAHFRDKLHAMGVSKKTKFYIESTVADSSYVSELDLAKKCISYSEKKIFLYLSRIEKEKGVFLAIDAFVIFCRKNPNSTLIIAGDGKDLDAAKKFTKDKRIMGIQFLGHVDGEVKKRILLTSHVMIFPSYSEGMPNCVLEGMLYGMPVISRNIGAIPDIITPGKNGFLTESFDPTVYADLMQKLANDIVLYKSIAEENHRKASSNYTTEKVRERILSIYRDL